MPPLPPPTRLRDLIEQAMKDRAPRMYQVLKRKGQLEKFLEDRAELAWTSYETQVSAASENALLESRKLSHQETVNELTQGRNEAASAALDQAVDFTAPEPRIAPIGREAAANGFTPGNGPRRPGF